MPITSRISCVRQLLVLASLAYTTTLKQEISISINIKRFLFLELAKNFFIDRVLLNHEILFQTTPVSVNF